MSFLDLADALHTRARSFPILARATYALRTILAVGFLAPGLHKVLGKRFHNPEILTVETEVGFWFEAFFRTGLYYQFVGVMQMLAALLLLIPATATLGAFVYATIMLNIFLITLSMEFSGTPIVTGSMLLGSIYLLAWDFPRWRALLPGGDHPATGAPAHAGPQAQPLHALELTGLAVIFVSANLFFLGARGLGLPFAFVATVSGTLAGATLHAVGTWKALWGDPA